MTLGEFLIALGKRWRSILACVLVGLVLAAVWTSLRSKTYEADARVFVSVADAEETSAISASQFLPARVKSYALLSDSVTMLQAVIDELELDTTTPELSRQVAVANPADTSVLDVRVTSSDADEAARLANTTAAALATEVMRLETPKSGSGSSVSATITKPATAPTTPSSPSWPLNLVVGILAGLAAGIAYAMMRYALAAESARSAGRGSDTLGATARGGSVNGGAAGPPSIGGVTAGGSGTSLNAPGHRVRRRWGRG